MRAIKKIFLGFWCLVIVFLLFVCAIADRYTVPVLMYHNVESTDYFRTDTVSPVNLERQLKFLKTRGYQILTLSELVDGIKAGRKFKHNCVVVTFDDGMKNNFTAAYPLLNQYHIPAAFFISPGTIGNEDSLSWDDVLVMKKGGMSFGSHGMIQAYLPQVSYKDQLYEIEESKKILEAKLNQPIDFYAYPVGGFSEEIKNLLRKAGYRGAFTTNRGTDRLNRDVYEINRIRLGDHDTHDLILTAKLSGYYNLFRKLKKSH